MEFEKRIKEQVIKVLEQEALDNQTNLVELGLDSLKTIQLVVNLESSLGIVFEDSDLLLENFETIEKIMSTINKKPA
ncbi:acyl carrier protein [Cohnella sp. GCM10020058]|uniref:acyl carrier protein n=1 Tax=Cohnella sp. GCM10020058 TaxID=3317330 RepID=UPI003628AE0F